MCSSLTSLSLPPGSPSSLYKISFQDGETIYIPLSASSTRLLITGVETSNAFALVGSSGSQSDPIGFHYHERTHDVFLCLKGNVNVWADDGNGKREARTLGVGDFASVPPGTIHQYQILGPHASFIGLIVPGGWESFFRVIGDPYTAGPLWPMTDERKFHEVLLPRLKQAAQEFDMIPCPQHPYFEPTGWNDGEGEKLPGKAEGYFLREGRGPAWLAGGIVVRPLITTEGSGGKFSIASLESSSYHQDASILSNRHLIFSATQHAFLVVEGVVEFSTSSSYSSTTTLHAQDILYIPAKEAFRFSTLSRYAKLYVFASGRGIQQILCRTGVEYSDSIPPEKATSIAGLSEKLKDLEEEVGFEVVG